MPPKNPSNRVTRKTHVWITSAIWIFDELAQRIGVRNMCAAVGVSHNSYYIWRNGETWRLDRKYARAAIQLLAEVRREQEGWTPEQARQFRLHFRNLKLYEGRRKSHMHRERDETGRWIPRIDSAAIAQRLAENSIDLERFGHEELRKRHAERAADSASTNGVAPQVPVVPGPGADV